MTAITPLLAARDRRTPAATTTGLPELRGHRQAPRRGSAARVLNPRTLQSAEPTGNHTDGITVADLIAKVTGPSRDAPTGTGRTRARSRTRPPTRPVEPRRRGDSAADDPDAPGHRGHPGRSAYAVRAAGSERPTRAGYRRHASATVVARRQPEPHHGRGRAMLAGRAAGGRDRGAGAGADRRGVAVAVREEQHAQQGVRAGPGFARHPRPERAVRRRELPHRRRGQPLRREQRHGRGRHRGRRRRPLGHHDAGQHPRQPRTRCRRVVSARPRHHADRVRGVGSRDRRVRTGLGRRDAELRSRRGVHRDQAEFRLFLRRAEVPGEGDPEAVGPVRQPVHGGRLRRLLEDGRRARRCRGVQHHPAGGLRAGHRAAHRRPPGHRRAHRAELCPRPAR